MARLRCEPRIPVGKTESLFNVMYLLVLKSILRIFLSRALGRHEYQEFFINTVYYYCGMYIIDWHISRRVFKSILIIYTYHGCVI